MVKDQQGYLNKCELFKYFNKYTFDDNDMFRTFAVLNEFKLKILNEFVLLFALLYMISY